MLRSARPRVRREFAACFLTTLLVKSERFSTQLGPPIVAAELSTPPRNRGSRGVAIAALRGEAPLGSLLIFEYERCGEEEMVMSGLDPSEEGCCRFSWGIVDGSGVRLWDVFADGRGNAGSCGEGGEPFILNSDIGSSIWPVSIL